MRYVNRLVFRLPQAQLRASVFLALEEQESQQVSDKNGQNDLVFVVHVRILYEVISVADVTSKLM